MTKKELIVGVICLIVVCIVALPLEIAIFKSWRAGLTDAVNWDGRVR